MTEIIYLVPKYQGGRGITRNGRKVVKAAVKGIDKMVGKVNSVVNKVAMKTGGAKARAKTLRENQRVLHSANEGVSRAEQGVKNAADLNAKNRQSFEKYYALTKKKIYDKAIAAGKTEEQALKAAENWSKNNFVQKGWQKRGDALITEGQKNMDRANAVLEKSKANRNRVNELTALKTLANARALLARRATIGAVGLAGLTGGAIGLSGSSPEEAAVAAAASGNTPATPQGYQQTANGWTYDGSPVQAGDMGWDRNGSLNYYDGSNWVQEGNYRQMGDGSIIDKTTGAMIQPSMNTDYFGDNMARARAAGLDINTNDDVANLQRQLIASGLLHPGDDDGYFGRKTMAALMATQNPDSRYVSFNSVQ